MTDVFDDGVSGDFHRELAEAARRFTTSVDAPDVWSHVLAQTKAASSPRRSFRNLAAAAIVLMVALVSVAVLGADERRVSLTVAVEPDDEPVSQAVAGQPTAQADALAGTDDECSQDLVAELGAEAESAFERGASHSPQYLSLASARVLRGEIVGVEPSIDGSFLLYELTDGADTEALVDPQGRRAALWTYAFPDEDFRASFVAFMFDGPPAHETDEYVAMPVEFGGLWVACDTTSPAASPGGTPTDEGWAELLADGLTLDELWELAAFPDGTFEQVVTRAETGNEANVFDVQLLVGDRLRVAIPWDLGDRLTVVERRAPLPVVLELDGATAELFFEPCQGGVPGPNGAFLEFVEDRLTLCRPDEGIRLEVTSADGSRLALNGWDVAPMAIGRRLTPFVDSTNSIAGCELCTSFGPLYFGTDNVTYLLSPDDTIVYRPTLSKVVGYGAEDLAFGWTVNFEPSTVSIGWIANQVLVDVHDGPLVVLDPSDGTEVWRVEREVGEGEPVVRVVGDLALLLTSFDREGFEDRAPVARAVDPVTGEVLWRAEGEAGRRWGRDLVPVVVDDVAFVYDVPTSLSGSPAAGGTAHLHGYDLESGERWTHTFADLGERSIEPNSNPDIDRSTFISEEEASAEYQRTFRDDRETTEPWLDGIEVESGKVVLVRTQDGVLHRFDPSGRELWAVDPGSAIQDGTDFAADGSLALSLAGTHGRILLDPATGGPVRSDDDQVCVALVGLNPAITLFEDRRPGCVIVGDFQRIRIFNKGSGPTAVEWVDGPVRLPSDRYYDTDLVEQTLPAGMSSFDASPSLIDDIWRMPRWASPTARFSIDGDSFGPVKVGMTVGQAAAAFGVEVVVEDFEAFVDDQRLQCAVARVAQDPYSPLFVLGDSVTRDDAAIAEIVADWPAVLATSGC